MKIYTFQIARWRAVDRLGIKRIDTTVKSGEPLLAPTWGMVTGVKEGSLSEARYTELYLELMRNRIDLEPLFFKDFLSTDTIALGCYCKAGAFCHRYLLVELLKTMTEVEYLGEIQ